MHPDLNMVEFIFSIDYEIYGNGEGSLRELVYEPAANLKEIFQKYGKKFVLFVEVAELERIEEKGTDADIDLVKKQIRDLYKDDFELGLHIHPGWYNARYENGRWLIDYDEYNLSTLPKHQIIGTLDRAISYLRKTLKKVDFVPFSFRAGHLLFEPTVNLALALAERGIKLDSSVYKGGLWRQHNLDYRRALKNGYYWRFTDNINDPDPRGVLLEVPIYSRMVPTWRMLTSKRIDLQQKGMSATQKRKKISSRVLDYLRLRSPLKLDLGQMTTNELIRMVDQIIKDDQKDPLRFKPVVVIGHTKELVNSRTIDYILSYLLQKGISISTFESAFSRCK